MANVSIDLDTSVSPDRVLHALTDFSSRRFDLWPNVDRNYFKMGPTSETTADVTEGSRVFGGVWETSHYDWSQSGKVRIDVIDSNTFQPGSYWIYDVKSRPNGGSHVHMEFDRRPKNFKGKIIGALLSLVGGRMYAQQLSETLHRLEQHDRRAAA